MSPVKCKERGEGSAPSCPVGAHPGLTTASQMAPLRCLDPPGPPHPGEQGGVCQALRGPARPPTWSLSLPGAAVEPHTASGRQLTASLAADKRGAGAPVSSHRAWFNTRLRLEGATASQEGQLAGAAHPLPSPAAAVSASPPSSDPAPHLGSAVGCPGCFGVSEANAARSHENQACLDFPVRATPRLAGWLPSPVQVWGTPAWPWADGPTCAETRLEGTQSRAAGSGSAWRPQAHGSSGVTPGLGQVQGTPVTTSLASGCQDRMGRVGHVTTLSL